MTRATRILGQIVRRFRYDLLAILLLAAIMAAGADSAPPAAMQSVSGVVPFLGTVVAIFLGFRNRNAYNRWWEARTLWSGVVVNARSLHYALVSYEDGSPTLAAIANRLRRRETRHAWQLAAELRGTAPNPELADLTPEDPPSCTATELLSRQAADIGELSHLKLIDRQARRVLVTISNAQGNTAVGLERIQQQPIPRFYDMFIRALAWFFAVLVCMRMEGSSHTSVTGIALGVIVMVLVIAAERLGSLLEEPMSADVFGLPLNRYCATVTADLLGPVHPLAGEHNGIVFDVEENLKVNNI